MFKTLIQLIEDLFKVYSPAISPQDVKSLVQEVQDLRQSLKTMTDDLLAIKAFLGIPDVRIGATQADLDAFSAKLAKATQTVTAFDAEIKATQAVQGFDEGLQKDAH